MIYTFDFKTLDEDTVLLQLFTATDTKVSVAVVNKAIKLFNKVSNSSDNDKYVVTSERNKNILTFDGSKTGIKCVIQRALNEQEIKSSTHYIYISETSMVGVSSNDIVKEVVTYYDENFCKCLIDLGNGVGNNKTQVRYGKPFNGIFDSSIDNRRIQIRLADGKLRFKPTSIDEVIKIN